MRGTSRPTRPTPPRSYIQTVTTSRRVAFYTLGCKVNQAETDQLTSQFAAAGFQPVPFDSVADIYVVNTCSVTHVGDSKSRQILRQARRTSPGAMVVATGCYASVTANRFPIPDALIVRNRDKDRLLDIVLEAIGREDSTVSRPMDDDKYVAQGLLDPSETATRCRPMVKVQDGCDSACSYCIIPRARGRSRSIEPSQVVASIEGFHQQGYPEVVITGVDLGSYGDGSESYGNLGSLLERILQETSILRVRVSSVEPGDFDTKWLSLWRDPRLCRHLHVPLQAGSDSVLVRMRRKYSTGQYLEMVRAIREEIPGVAVTTDVITGFPGESDKDFEDGMAFIEGCDFDGIHVFPYSQRSGTAAARLDSQVPEPVKKMRSSELRNLAERSREKHVMRFLGSIGQVVWEEERSGVWRGITDNNVRTFSSDEGIRPRQVEQRLLATPHGQGAWAEKLSPL